MSAREHAKEIRAAASAFNEAVAALHVDHPGCYVDLDVDTVYVVGIAGGIPIIRARVSESL